MASSWFRWEREASIHLLFPTLEVFYPLLTSYSGVSAPTMILIFQKGVVTWCIGEEEFIKYGEDLLKVYSDPKKEQKMVSDIKEALKNLKNVEDEIRGLNLKDLGNKDLIQLHSKLYSAFLAYYTMGAIGTPLSFSAEIILKKKGLTDEELNLLTTPDEISYVSEADDYLLETKDIEGFRQKYFWINANYSGAEAITVGEVKKRLKELIAEKAPIVKKESVSDLKSRLGKEEKRIIELLKNYSVYKDNRKKEILIYLYYIDNLLKEIAERLKLTMDEVRASLPYEVGDLLNGKVSKRDLQKRLEYSVIVWEKGAKKCKLLLGDDSKKWEERTLEKIKDAPIILGRTACSGKVKGKVRILLKAEDCDELKKGEVLVTFMTSPDFMPAIRKCSAIVTNLGGVTSHAAIISRELKIPCIVGTKIATQVLKNGDKVEVNADKGMVKKL